MLKWLITFGLLAWVAWRWYGICQKFLAKRGAAKSVPNQRSATSAAPQKSLVVSCCRCKVLLPPELAHKRGEQYYCSEHVPD